MNMLFSFKTIFIAIVQILLIGALGFCLRGTKKISPEGLHFLSIFVIDVTLPLFIFTRLVKNFQFYQYSNWWLFPVLSIAITISGFLVGFGSTLLDKTIQAKKEFISLVAFQNSGYLPLILVDFILQGKGKETMFIYIFLFLIGFNLIIWSIGVSYLVSKRKAFEFASLFSPPVIATLVAFLFLLLGLGKYTPEFMLRPLQLLGDCTLPLAMILVGANLAESKSRGRFDRMVFDIVLLKLFLIPLCALVLLRGLNLFNLIGMLIMLQVSMPSATSLSIIAGYHKLEDKLISRAVFWTHIFSLITIPLFLGLFFWMGMLQ